MKQTLTLQVMDIESVHKLPPPVAALGVGGGLEVILAQLPCQVDEGHGNCLRLPLQAQLGDETERETESAVDSLHL